MRTAKTTRALKLATLLAAGSLLTGCVDLGQPFSFNFSPEQVKQNGPYTLDLAESTTAPGTYDVTVTPGAGGSNPPPPPAPTPTEIALAWVAPSTRVSGAALPLSEIQGYVIRYGTAAGNYTQSVAVNSGAATSYKLTGLSPSTYYIVISAKDTAGNVGPTSAELTRTLQ